MSGPYFETWTHENLVKFAKEAYEKLQRQEEELQRLRWPFPETRPATREEKIVNPGVYEVPTCSSCAKLKTKIATLEQGIRQVGAALKEAMT